MLKGNEIQLNKKIYLKFTKGIKKSLQTFRIRSTINSVIEMRI